MKFKEEDFYKSCRQFLKWLSTSGNKANENENKAKNKQKYLCTEIICPAKHLIGRYLKIYYCIKGKNLTT